MALKLATFDTIEGLNSSVNVTRRAPNSLTDCMDIVYTRVDAAQARKGHPDYWLPTSSEINENAWHGIFQHPVGDQKFYIPYTGSTVGQIALLASQALSSSAIVKKYVATARTEEVADGSYAPRFAWDVTTDVEGFNLPRVVNAQENQYVTAANGIFRNVQGGDNDILKKVIPSTVKALNLSVSTTVDVSDQWFEAGYRVSATALVREQISETGYLEWQDVGDVVISNYGSRAGLLATIVVEAPNIKDLEDAYIEVYRTVQYKVDEGAPVEKFFTTAIPLSKGTVSGTQVTFTAVLLNQNDDWVSSQTILYYSGDVRERNGQAPVSKFTNMYKGYTIYSNITPTPVASLTITDTPSAGNTLKINDIAAVAFRSFANSASVPSTSGFLTEWTTSVAGTSSYRGSPTSTYPLVLRYLPETDGGQTKIYGSRPHIKTTKKLQYVGTGDTRTIKCFMNVSDIADKGAFIAPGICAVVDAASANNGVIRDIFSYTDIEFIPTSGKMEFQGTRSVSNWTSTWYETSRVIGSATNEDLYLYFIPGTSLDAVDIYPIGEDAAAYTVGGTTYANFRGFTLLPAQYNYQSQFFDRPVGRVKAFTYSSSRINASIDFFGIGYRDKITQTVRATEQWVKEYNAIRASVDPLASFYIGDQTINIRFENIKQGVEDGVIQNFINVAKTGTFNTEPDIVGTTNLVYNDDIQSINGTVVSKLNLPELVTVKQLQSPLKVGRDDRQIIGQAVTNNDIYMFKDREGVYRADIAEGPVSTRFTGLYLIDNTVWCVAPESIQEIDESVYFLSNKGFARITGNQITIVSGPIDIEVRNQIEQSSPSASAIRSFGNEIRKLYGCYLPDASGGVTYVLDILAAKWSKWSIKPTDCTVTRNGRLITSNNLTAHTLGWRYLRGDVFTFGIDDDVDQYDLSHTLTGALSTTVANTLVVTRTDATSIYGSIGFVADRIGTLQAYYYDGSSYYRIDITRDSDTQITLDFGLETPPTFADTHSIVVGVNARLDFNKYFAAGIARTSQFSKYSAYVMGQSNDVRIKFAGSEDDLSFSTSEVLQFSQECDIITTWVPRQQARGNWVTSRVEHFYPKQGFELDAITYVIRAINSDRVERGQD